MCCVKKLLTPLSLASTSSITVQRLGKILLRAPAVGAKIWCLFLSVCHAPSPAGRLLEEIYFEQLLCRDLWIDFDSVFRVFFRIDFPFRSRR